MVLGNMVFKEKSYFLNFRINVDVFIKEVVYNGSVDSRKLVVVKVFDMRGYFGYII